MLMLINHLLRICQYMLLSKCSKKMDGSNTKIQVITFTQIMIIIKMEILEKEIKKTKEIRKEIFHLEMLRLIVIYRI
ncbi:MAG: hypothetical protein CMH58_10335 [Myxococcales bacterium]|nr:hypothetical protein [Myxococcales bacterium]